jgi:hypothetical protein
MPSAGPAIGVPRPPPSVSVPRPARQPDSAPRTPSSLSSTRPMRQPHSIPPTPASEPPAASAPLPKRVSAYGTPVPAKTQPKAIEVLSDSSSSLNSGDDDEPLKRNGSPLLLPTIKPPRPPTAQTAPSAAQQAPAAPVPAAARSTIASGSSPSTSAPCVSQANPASQTRADTAAKPSSLKPAPKSQPLSPAQAELSASLLQSTGMPLFDPANKVEEKKSRVKLPAATSATKLRGPMRVSPSLVSPPHQPHQPETAAASPHAPLAASPHAPLAEAHREEVRVPSRRMSSTDQPSPSADAGPASAVTKMDVLEDDGLLLVWSPAPSPAPAASASVAVCGSSKASGPAQTQKKSATFPPPCPAGVAVSPTAAPAIESKNTATAEPDVAPMAGLSDAKAAQQQESVAEPTEGSDAAPGPSGRRLRKKRPAAECANASSKKRIAEQPAAPAAGHVDSAAAAAAAATAAETKAGSLSSPSCDPAAQGAATRPDTSPTPPASSPRAMGKSIAIISNTTSNPSHEAEPEAVGPASSALRDQARDCLDSARQMLRSLTDPKTAQFGKSHPSEAWSLQVCVCVCVCVCECVCVV